MTAYRPSEFGAAITFSRDVGREMWNFFKRSCVPILGTLGKNINGKFPGPNYPIITRTSMIDALLMVETRFTFRFYMMVLEHPLTVGAKVWKKPCIHITLDLNCYPTNNLGRTVPFLILLKYYVIHFLPGCWQWEKKAVKTQAQGPGSSESWESPS